MADTKQDVSEKFALGFGVSSGMGVLLQVTNKLGIKAECSPTYAFARLKEITYEQDGQKQTIIFKKDEKVLPDDTATKTYYHGAPMYSFSSIAAKVGLLINVGR